jgi:hypothetical protein
MVFFVIMLTAGLAFYHLLKPGTVAAKAEQASAPALNVEASGLMNREVTSNASV